MGVREWGNKLIENTRFRIAYKLDELDRYCWADLVMWALGYRDFSDVGQVKQCLRHDGPYCGKCEKYIPSWGKWGSVSNPVWNHELKMWVEKSK